MICLDQKVKWWKVLSDRHHVLIQHDYCVDDQPGMYAEYPDGSTQFISVDEWTVSTWNWQLLTVMDREFAKELYRNGDIKELTKLHNTHLLSGSYICCDTESVRLNFKAAIENQLI